MQRASAPRLWAAVPLGTDTKTRAPNEAPKPQTDETLQLPQSNQMALRCYNEALAFLLQLPPVNSRVQLRLLSRQNSPGTTGNWFKLTWCPLSVNVGFQMASGSIILRLWSISSDLIRMTLGT